MDCQNPKTYLILRRLKPHTAVQPALAGELVEVIGSVHQLVLLVDDSIVGARPSHGTPKEGGSTRR